MAHQNDGNLLTRPVIQLFYAPPLIIDWIRIMAKVCEITGARVRRGSRIHRSGLAKKKGGIGRHVTKVVKRDVSPNLRNKRIWVPELNKSLGLSLQPEHLRPLPRTVLMQLLRKRD